MIAIVVSTVALATMSGWAEYVCVLLGFGRGLSCSAGWSRERGGTLGSVPPVVALAKVEERRSQAVPSRFSLGAPYIGLVGREGGVS